MLIPAGVVALVDDDVYVLQALERALVSYQYRVRTYTSAEEYLAHANAGEILCTVIDIQLGGGLSGLDLGEMISESIHPTPVVFMTGSDDSALHARALDIGCAAFLHKPFLTSMLIGTIMTIEGRDYPGIRPRQVAP